MTIAVGFQEDDDGSRRVLIVLDQVRSGISTKLARAVATEILLMADLIDGLDSQDQGGKRS